MSGDFNKATYAGLHLIIDLWGSDPCLLRDPNQIRNCLVDAAKVAGATVLSDSFHYFGEEHGVTGVVVLSESHISIHTWPEEHYAAIDAFMCGDCDPRNTIGIITEGLKSQHHDTNLLFRGARPLRAPAQPRDSSVPRWPGHSQEHGSA